MPRAPALTRGLPASFAFVSKNATPPFSWRAIAVSAYGPSFLFGISEGALFPVMALSAKALGANVAEAGVVATLLGIGALLGNLPATTLTARHGERRAMMGAALFCSLSLLLCVLAGSVLWLALGVLLFGIGSSVFLLARLTYLTEAVPLPLRARALSTLGGVMRIGMFVGPFCAAALMHWTGLAGAYWVAIAAMLGAGMLSFAVPDLIAPPASQDQPAGPRPAAQSLWKVLRTYWRAYATLGSVCALVNGIRACRQVIVPLWGLHIGLDPATTALVYGIMGAMDVLLFYPAGRIMDLRGRRWAVVPSMILMAVGFAWMILSDSLLSFTLACMLIGLGNGMGSGIVMTIGADISPAHARTRFLGGWRFLNDVGSSGGPILVSAVAAVASLASGISLISAVGLLAAALFWRWLPKDNQPARVPGA